MESGVLFRNCNTHRTTLMIVFMTEEPSMRVTLETLITRFFPQRLKDRDWMISTFSGKSDLEKNIPLKMLGWKWGNPFFIILRDADGGDCVALKEHLAELAHPCGPDYKIRVVCQELESWFIGDCEAVRKAYPRCIFSNETKRYRNPDRLTNASEELSKLTGDRTKGHRAKSISVHLDPSRNCSRSFQVLFETLQQHLG